MLSGKKALCVRHSSSRVPGLSSPSPAKDVRTDLHKKFCVSSKILQILQKSPLRGTVFYNVWVFESPKGK